MDKKKKRPKSAALSDAEKSGLSVFRKKFVSDEKIRETAEKLVTRARENSPVPQEAGVFGVLEFECSDVRGFVLEADIRPYCIYDTALPDDCSHAEAFQRIDGVEDPIKLERRRKLFASLEGKFIPVDEFRDGLLSDFAPLC